MSDSFWKFSIQCPVCKNIIKMADGYETDDWAEMFTFSGTRETSYKCQNCGEKTDIDELYRLAYISTDAIESIKQYMSANVYYVSERGGLHDHYWDPDIEKALERYSLLYPEDKDLLDLRELYFYALHAPYLLPKNKHVEEE